MSTVAELLARQTAGTELHAPVALEAVESDAEEMPTRAVSVAALLRREESGPRRADGRLVPRRHSRAAPGPAGATGRNMRRGTAVAGVLLAAGAVFGGAVIDTAVSDHPAADDEAAGGGGAGGIGEASGALGAVAAGTDVGADPGAPVDGVALASAAVLSADVVPISAAAARDSGDPGSAAGAQPTSRSSGGPVGEPSSRAGDRDGRVQDPARGGSAGGHEAEPGGPGSGGPGARRPVGGPEEERGKGRGSNDAGSDGRGSGSED